MENKIKVLNPQGYKITINLKAFNGKTIPLAPKVGYTFLTEDELAYINNTSKAFLNGDLKIVGNEEKVADLGISNDNANAMSEEDMGKFLKKTLSEIKEGLQEIDNGFVLSRIYELAVEANKSVKICQAIQDRQEEVLK